MEQFAYKATSYSGEKFQGIVEAKDKEHAIKILRDKNLIITFLQDTKKDFSYKFKSYFAKISQKHIIEFTRQMSAMLNSGLPIVQSLSLVRKDMKNSAMSAVVSEIQSDIESGESLYNSLTKHSDIFPPIYLALVKAGELAGVLGEVLERLSINLENDQDFRSKVKSSMVYPIIVISAMFVVGLIMIFFVMPKMIELFENFDAKLPLTTQIMVTVSKVMINYWYLFLFLVVSAGVSLFYFIKSKPGREFIDYKVLQLPLIGDLIKKIISTNITRTLSLLNGAGVSIIESLGVVSKITSNVIYQNNLTNASKRVEKGISLADSLGNDEIFPEAVIQMISVGEETGKLAEMLEKIAVQYEKESTMALKTLTAAIEPTLIIILGLGVGFMVVAIIFPIYSLTSSI